MTKLIPITPEYREWLAEIKSHITTAQIRATFSVNAEMIRLYWNIGRGIIDKQIVHGWGAKIIELLAKDLRAAFPEMKGFSPTNLKYMRRFAEECRDLTFGQQPADQLPWFHIVTLLTRLSDAKEREWYASMAIEHGWSRNILEIQIDARAHCREGKAITNFSTRLPSSNSDMALQALKDPYIFDFLGLS
jgi:predicted nuclease of restriction endonuclease-like (RecB) superfamily